MLVFICIHLSFKSSRVRGHNGSRTVHTKEMFVWFGLLQYEWIVTSAGHIHVISHDTCHSRTQKRQPAPAPTPVRFFLRKFPIYDFTVTTYFHNIHVHHYDKIRSTRWQAFVDLATFWVFIQPIC